MASIYKIVSAAAWRSAEAAGEFTGAAIDIQDGYIHFSSAAQVRETAEKHFAGVADLLLVTVNADQLPIKWEPSRGGALFPHLYGTLPMRAVTRVAELKLCASGGHAFPDLEE